MRHCLKTVCVNGNMNQIHVKLVDFNTHMLSSCVLLWCVPVGHLHQPPSWLHHSANNHQFIIVWTCALSLYLTRTHTHTHTGTQAHTRRHTWIAWGRPSILISTLLQSADGKLSVCQSHKLTHPSRHYLIIMISHKCLIVMTSRHQIHGLAFFDYITLGQFMPRPLSLKNQGQNADCETGSSLESNYQFYYWDESIWFSYCCPVRRVYW